MRPRIIYSALVAALISVTLTGSGAALADGGRNHDGWRDSGHRIDHRKQHYGDHRRHRDHVIYRNYYYGHPGHVNRYYNYDDNDDGDENLLIGLALGGLIGYAISNGDYNY